MSVLGRLRPVSSFIPLLGRYPKKHSLVCANRLLSTTSRRYHDNDDESALQENPFYPKYEVKIKKMKESGVYTAPTEHYNKALLRETKVWKQNIQNLEKRLTEKKAKEEESKISGLTLPASLDALMRLDLIADVSADEMAKLWTKHWSDKGTISAVITKDVFDSMRPRIKEFPVFLYPLPREQGYEFYMSQFSEHHCFFTSLLNYQVNGEDAPWQICFKFYPELSESKGIVLMACEFDGSTLDVLETQYLAQLQQLFYANPTEARLQLMRNFNHFPDSFKYMDVVKEIESGDFVVKK